MGFFFLCFGFCIWVEFFSLLLSFFSFCFFFLNFLFGTKHGFLEVGVFGGGFASRLGFLVWSLDHVLK